jgi:hypothetical protein
LTVSESQDSTTVSVDITGVDPVAVFGTEDRLLKVIEEGFPELKFLARGNHIEITGALSQVLLAQQRVEQIIAAVSSGREITPADLRRSEPDLLSQSILSSRGKSIRPKTTGQKSYVEAIDRNTIVFGIGPAGTGKSGIAAVLFRIATSAIWRRADTLLLDLSTGRSDGKYTQEIKKIENAITTLDAAKEKTNELNLFKDQFIAIIDKNIEKMNNTFSLLDRKLKEMDDKQKKGII